MPKQLENMTEPGKRPPVTYPHTAGCVLAVGVWASLTGLAGMIVSPIVSAVNPTRYGADLSAPIAAAGWTAIGVAVSIAAVCALLRWAKWGE